jgi:hypothetical protein
MQHSQPRILKIVVLNVTAFLSCEYIFPAPIKLLTGSA